MIVVLDYGMGNLRSVSKALEHLGAKVRVSSSFQDLEKSDKVVLPGVGAFGDCMHELKRRDLAQPLTACILAGKPFLGICLGLQLLLDESEESPGCSGLGIIQGKVRAFRSTDVKIPHMGWNSVDTAFEHPLLRGIHPGEFFYFVHSYYAVPDDSRCVAATCRYGQETFAAMLGTKTTFATQFHPEKSQSAGLKILKNFIEWMP